MDRLTKFIKKIPIILSSLIIISVLLHGIPLYIHAKAVEISAYSCFELFQYNTNNYLMKNGNRYAAFDIIHYFREVYEYPACDSANQSTVLNTLYNKYPDMREQYLAAMVDGILDEKTKTFQRNQLIGYLKELTGIDFENIPEEVHYEEAGPYEYKAVSEVEEWWEEHNRERLLNVQAVMKADPYYSGKPEESKEGNDDAP